MAVLTAVLGVFSAVGEWIASGMKDLIPIFWTEGTGGEGSLTFFGVLAVAGLAFSVIFLLLGIVAGFLHFRGA